MKRSNFWSGLVFLLLGIGFLALEYFWPTPLGSLMWGFGGGCIGCGISTLAKYWKWSRPANAAVYQEMLEQEQIELKDERKAMLRNRAGHSAYGLFMILCPLFIMVFSILGKLGLIENSRMIILFLAVFWLLEYAAGIFFYRRLNAKY